MRQHRISFVFALSAALLAGSAMLPVAPSYAQGRLRAHAYLTQARVPRHLSERALLGFARRNRAPHLREVTDVPIPERSWVANLIVSFNRPIGDLEFHVLFYDVDRGGPRRFLRDMTTFVSDRDEKTFVQTIRLDRPRFVPNRDMELVITVRQHEVATARFGLTGEEIRRTGEVDFEQNEDGEAEQGQPVVH